MSKKINIVTPGFSRNSLWPVFRQYLIRKRAEEDEKWMHRCHHHDCYVYGYDDDYELEMEKLREYYGIEDHPGWDDDYYVDDDGVIVYPMKDKKNSNGKYKHTKHRSRHRSNRARVIDINEPYSGEEEDFNDNDPIGGEIYFYPDYNDKYERLEFDSLLEFDEYCQEEGFIVPPYVGEKIAYKPVSHCCLNPMAKERGVLEVMAEENYGDLVYEACDLSELG